MVSLTNISLVRKRLTWNKHSSLVCISNVEKSCITTLRKYKSCSGRAFNFKLGRFAPTKLIYGTVIVPRLLQSVNFHVLNNQHLLLTFSKLDPSTLRYDQAY
jgi:hypothetical protein